MKHITALENIQRRTTT